MIIFFALRIAGKPKLPVRKGIRLVSATHHVTHIYLSTHCGCTIVERIVMSKRKASDDKAQRTNKSNKSTDYVFYNAGRKITRYRRFRPQNLARDLFINCSSLMTTVIFHWDARQILGVPLLLNLPKQLKRLKYQLTE
jgi:hypothetical protein